MNTADHIRLSSPYMEEDNLKSGLSGKHEICMGPQRCLFTERLFIGDAKATLNQAALDIGIHLVEYFNKVLVEMTKHAFPAFIYCK